MKLKYNSILSIIWLLVFKIIWFTLIEYCLNKGVCLRYVFTVFATIKTLISHEHAY